jgi:hypothetical protein
VHPAPASTACTWHFTLERSARAWPDAAPAPATPESPLPIP